MQALNRNIKSLNIIRGIAALIVVINHSKFILWAGGTLWLKNVGFKNFWDYLFFSIDMLSSCGAQCVQVFFLLSGFVIYLSFQHLDKMPGHFFVVRALRIYIPFLFSLLISITVLFFVVKFNNGIAVDNVREYNTRMLYAYNDRSFFSTVKAFFFLPGREYAGFNSAYWSLLHEAIFYLVFPIYFFIGFRNRIFLFIAYFTGYLITKNYFLYFQLYFLFGMFLYDYYKRDPGLLLKNRHLYIPLIIVCFCATNVLVKTTPFYADLAGLCTALLCFDRLLLRDFSYNRFFKSLADVAFPCT